jgi:hypothetical protein
MSWLARLSERLRTLGEQAWFVALADSRIALPDGLYVAGGDYDSERRPSKIPSSRPQLTRSAPPLSSAITPYP